MLHRHLMTSLLAGVVFVSAGSLAQAACCPPPCPPPCNTITRTITVMEMVPETYEVNRTSYRSVQVQESYTAYKTISVPETRTCTRTVQKCVPYYTEECRTCYKCVPCTEQRTVMKKVVTCKPVCCTVRKCIDCGHYECCTEC